MIQNVNSDDPQHDVHPIEADMMDIPEIKDCPEELKKKAEHYCHQIPEKSVHEGCIFDVCTTNTTFAAIDSFILEILKVKFGKNIVEFEGSGRCLDQDSMPYTTLTNLGEMSRASCIAVIEQAKGIEGVQGIQIGWPSGPGEGPPGGDLEAGLHEGPDASITCQIVAEPDKQYDALPGGPWGNKEAGTGK